MVDVSGVAPADRACKDRSHPHAHAQKKRPIRKSNPSHTVDSGAATPVASWAVKKKMMMIVGGNDGDRTRLGLGDNQPASL